MFKSDRHVESFMGDRVTDSIFLNPVTDEELLNIVHNAKDNKSKGYDGIDMCMLKKIIPHRCWSRTGVFYILPYLP